MISTMIAAMIVTTTSAAIAATTSAAIAATTKVSAVIATNMECSSTAATMIAATTTTAMKSYAGRFDSTRVCSDNSLRLTRTRILDGRQIRRIDTDHTGSVGLDISYCQLLQYCLEIDGLTRIGCISGTECSTFDLYC